MTHLETAQEIGKAVDLAFADFEKIANETWNAKPNPAKWSKKELLGHLVDSASNNLRRLVVGQYEQETKIVYHQDEWVAYQDYQSAPVEELKTLWLLLNRQYVRVIKNIPEHKLQNVCDTGKVEVALHTLAYFIEDYLVHLNYHLAQILGTDKKTKAFA